MTTGTPLPQTPGTLRGNQLYRQSISGYSHKDILMQWPCDLGLLAVVRINVATFGTVFLYQRNIKDYIVNTESTII